MRVANCSAAALRTRRKWRRAARDGLLGEKGVGVVWWSLAGGGAAGVRRASGRQSGFAGAGGERRWARFYDLGEFCDRGGLKVAGVREGPACGGAGFGVCSLCLVFGVQRIQRIGDRDNKSECRETDGLEAITGGLLAST